MLRVTRVHEGSATVRLRVEGRLTSVCGDELERACHRLLEEGKRVLLDFMEVSFIDRDGVEMLRRLLAHPVRVVNTTPLIDEVISDIDQS